jgi:hypothetical protein
MNSSTALYAAAGATGPLIYGLFTGASLGSTALWTSAGISALVAGISGMYADKTGSVAMMEFGIPIALFATDMVTLGVGMEALVTAAISSVAVFAIPYLFLVKLFLFGGHF